MAAADRRRAPRRRGSRVGALTLLAVAPLALHGAKSGRWRRWRSAPSRPAPPAGRERPRVWTGAGVAYAAAILAAPTLLRASPAYGFAAILWLFAVVWGADTLAFLGGRLIGGPRLWRRVSPGKTWSGAIVGALAGAAAGAVVACLAAPDGVRLAPLFWPRASPLRSSARSATSANSALKRHFAVKDSSRLIPGHGGVLDRLDAFVAVAIFAALVGWARSGGGWIAAGLLQW